MRFTKMHGLGNDYIFLDCTGGSPAGLPDLARRMSDRHFGVGSDGLICVFPSLRGDFRMEMYNADGSEGEMCGNGIRCLGKYVYERGLTDRPELDIETRAGVRRVALKVERGAVVGATVDMGEPVLLPGEGGPARRLELGGRVWEAIGLSMGNPHGVVFASGVEDLPLPALGEAFQRHPGFPRGVNLEAVEVCSRTRLRMRVWERGSGETLACGTGACAALAAAVLTDRADREAAVELPGGVLRVRWSREDGRITMSGPAVTVFHGEWPGGEEEIWKIETGGARDAHQ